MKVEEKNKILNWLQENNYLEYGTVIPKEILETLFRARITDEWDFRGPYLELKMLLEEEGFLCTTEDVPYGCLKIYDADEVALQITRIVAKCFKRLKRAQKCMVNTKMEELSYPDMKKHLHESNKLQSILYSIRDKLKDLD